MFDTMDAALEKLVDDFRVPANARDIAFTCVLFHRLAVKLEDAFDECLRRRQRDNGELPPCVAGGAEQATR